MTRARSRRRACIAAVVAVGAVVLLLAHAATADAPGPATDAALTHVQHEVDYIEHSALSLSKQRYPHAYLVALATMSYVVGHVSAPAYGYLTGTHRPPPSGGDATAVAESALASGAGICGHASNTMLSLLARQGVRARMLSFFYSTPAAPSNGHNAVEVYYGGGWHMFDPTWGRLFRRPSAKPWEVLPVLTVLKMSPAERSASAVVDRTLLWGQIVAQSHVLSVETGFAVFDLPHVRLGIGGKTVYSR